MKPPRRRIEASVVKPAAMSHPRHEAAVHASASIKRASGASRPRTVAPAAVIAIPLRWADIGIPAELMPTKAKRKGVCESVGSDPRAVGWGKYRASAGS